MAIRGDPGGHFAFCAKKGREWLDWARDGRRLTEMTQNKAEAKLRRILGVDPAAAGPTGYGIIETDGRDCRALHYGALRVPAKRRNASPGASLCEVHALLGELIEEFAPDAMAVEAVFSALNVRTALRLAEVRGVVLLAAEQHGIVVRSYSPREVKACVAGYGHADKAQMQAMVRTILRMHETPEPSDAADALAVALCHWQAEKLEQRFGVMHGNNGAIEVRAPKARREAAASAGVAGASGFRTGR